MIDPHRRSAIGLLVIITAALAVFVLASYGQVRQASVQVAVAKGKQLYDMSYMSLSRLDIERLEEVLLKDAGIIRMLDGNEYGLVNIFPLSYGESRNWRDYGCGQGNCGHATFYDFSDGGTVNAILRLEDDRVIERWREPDARPGGSASILSRAMAIAAADPEVHAVLDDIGEPDPAMIPMSAWLADDDCRQEWCVDLTYSDPGGTGRVFHIFVNLQQERVARTFFSRARAERSRSEPILQRNAYDDGCTEQHGWEVCWEMTAHDGVNFRDAIYQGQRIFSSAKIGQVEAWYPSWPGGYRDEIGFAASVPAFGGTEVTDLGNGFEVSQLFTEFTHWPNCICCYRYEEIIRFYADGALEFDFVSHGPGCDEIPSYRPFWRIDLDLDGPENDQVWMWQERQWIEVTSETEIHPLVEDLSPAGEKLMTFDGDLNYRWRMPRTDPLGRDEARLFLLHQNPAEGEGPIATGVGDTFQPPRQWLNGEQVSGQNVVLWYVPILKQLKGDPWWCMPDPDPDFTPCNALLRAEPGGELRQPTEEELAAAEAQPTATVVASPTATEGATRGPETATPLPPTPTIPPLDARDAEEVLLAGGCGSCHFLGAFGERRKVGPDLSNIGALAGERIAGMSAEAYLRQAIIDPNAFIAPNCPNGPCLPNIMPATYGQFLTEAQVETLVQYLLAQKAGEGAITVIGDESSGLATPAPKAFPAPKRLLQREPGPTAGVAIQLLLLCIVFLLSLFRLLKEPKRE